MFHATGFRADQSSRNNLWRRGLFACCVTLWLALLNCGVSGYAQAQRDATTQEYKWVTLTGCRLLTNQFVDGDSFHVTHKGNKYIFRLYFVDSPESDPALK